MPGYAIPDNLPSNLMVYAKMLKVGLAKQSVLNKMAMDGVPQEEFYKYLDPDKVAAPPPAAQEPDEFESDEEEDAANPLYAGGAADAAPASADAANPVVAPQTDLLAIEPSKVDMSGMNPMPIKKTLIIVNSFIAESVTFLNRFVATCEERLHLVDQRMERMKLRMLILENNLNSIDWLRQAPEPAAAPAPAENAPAQPGEPAAQQEGETATGGGEQPAEAPAASAGDSLRNDAKYALYFRMLKCRVPPPAVRNKMRSDGIPDDIQDQILDTGAP